MSLTELVGLKVWPIAESFDVAESSVVTKVCWLKVAFLEDQK